MATHPPQPLTTGTPRPPAPAAAPARPTGPAGRTGPAALAAPALAGPGDTAAATARPALSRLPGGGTDAARWTSGPTFRVIFAGSLLACACGVAPGGATAHAAEAPPGGVPAHTAPADRAPADRPPAAAPGERDPHTAPRTVTAGHPGPAGAQRPAAGAPSAPSAPPRARPARPQALADAGQGPMPTLALAAVVLLVGGAGLVTAARRLRG
ncbi:hypothetical protein [Streptomyces catenulae]|uniref:Uncharacterized protein n=1 Tax=Streptomyces catenulae TaxID=66875 RepID=A0ABV2Z928_9ACTN|nr:hypothetical protein [Streptomyces catenulae]